MKQHPIARAPNFAERVRLNQKKLRSNNWGFKGQPDPHVNGRSMPLSMGKIVDGGSSINGMGWAR